MKVNILVSWCIFLIVFKGDWQWEKTLRTPPSVTPQQQKDKGIPRHMTKC